MLWAEPARQIQVFLQKTLAYASREIRPGGGFWKERARATPIYSLKSLKTKVDYTHNNPVRRQLVQNADDWLHSSFRQIEFGGTDVPFVCDSWSGIVV